MGRHRSPLSLVLDVKLLVKYLRLFVEFSSPKQTRKEVTNMCCEPRDGGACCSDGHGAHHGHSGSCCCDPHGFARRFVTRAERLAALESYRDELTKELEGVSERISELSGS
jgi:hypothetical protein